MKYFLSILLFSTVLSAHTLDSLLEKVKGQNLSLQNAKERIMIEDVRAGIASTWDNPQIGIGANNLLIDDITTRDREAMQAHYVSLSQMIPTRGKREIEEKIAQLDRESADIFYHDRVMRLASQLRQYVYKVGILKEKIRLIDHYRANVKNIKQLHIKRLDIGKSTQSSIEEAKILEKRLLIKRGQFLRMKRAFLYKIERLVYEKIEDVDVSLKMDKVVRPSLKKHPIMIEETLKLSKARNNTILHQASKTPDVKLNLGYFQRVDRGDYLSVSVGMQLPVRGIEEANIKIAMLEESKKRREKEARLYALQREIDILKEMMDDALQNHTIIQKELLPKRHYIQKLLERELLTKERSTVSLLENLNAHILLELEAYGEMESYFDAYAKLSYFDGEVS